MNTVRGFFSILPLVAFCATSRAELPPPKSAPTRPASEANVVLERNDAISDCPDDKVCVQGSVRNNGARPAYHVSLKIEIGGSERVKPRAVLNKPLDRSTLAPGEAEDFSLNIPRQVPYRRNGKEKVIEVGLYNYHLVPAWAAAERPPARRHKRSAR